MISLSGELVGYLFKSSFGNEKLAKRMLSLKDERSRLFRVGSYVAMASFVFPNIGERNIPEKVYEYFKSLQTFSLLPFPAFSLTISL